ncbi:6-phosphogluconolactonase [Herbiconiux sp. L3-i23]|uniref:6-phosphogluconolactonase n=1 Tax=Herbiconiux sp. L3-i23 TaxID=2905871 RepID=UPI00205A11AC|nr:6-phosphogluconolactonase [Herbiconiux sp. L3-i23]BDI22727.1 6-phosphogluconolactonase [Herbiconiux sp. L3-i23]
MTNERRVLVHADSEALVGSVAARFITKMIDLLDEFDEAHVVLTGGTVGGAILEAVRQSPARDTVDWSRVHLWWGDERFVPAGHPDRNDTQAAGFLDSLTIPAEHIHRLPASDEIPDIDEAAVAYADELRRFAPEGAEHPRFDITFLGVGPDGHIASLFPERDIARATSKTVVPVLNSPKPPPERLSLTLPVINSSDRIWMSLAGADKAPALGLALAGASPNEVPVAGVQGRKRTVFFVDQAAAAQVPENLIASTY